MIGNSAARLVMAKRPHDIIIIHLLRSEYVYLDDVTLSNSSFVRVPANLWPLNHTVLNSFTFEDVSHVVKTSVGFKPRQATNVGIQPCLTYNPPGPLQPGFSPATNVSELFRISKDVVWSKNFSQTHLDLKF